MIRSEASERVDEKASKRLLDRGRMAEHQVTVIKAARLRFDCLDEDAGRGLNLVAGSLHPSERPRSGVIQQCSTPLREEIVLSLDYVGLDLATEDT